ncbi:hypothetical protein L7F22_029548 [Adiantum nelumboides]|nr:hypothetical protein [Adiantum nelumboides]
MKTRQQNIPSEYEDSEGRDDVDSESSDNSKYAPASEENTSEDQDQTKKDSPSSGGTGATGTISTSLVPCPSNALSDNPIEVISKAKEDDAKSCGELWPYALKMAERGKVSQAKLCEAGNCIHETTGWSDPIDSLSMYAYIAKSEANEAWVEKKQKRDEETIGSSKRVTRSNNKKEEVPKLTLEVNTEDAPKDKKQGKHRGPFYKLKSDIEMATNLKKIFEERILNSKVEMTLRDILGIAKREEGGEELVVAEIFVEVVAMEVEDSY